MMLYLRAVWFNFSVYLAYPFEIVGDVLQSLIEFGFRILFWAAVASTSLGAVNFRHISVYFLITTAIAVIVMFNKFGSVLGKYIKSGEMNDDLIKPVRILPYFLAGCIGRWGIRLLVAAVFLAIGLVLEPPAGWLGAGLFVVHLVLAFTISFAMNVLVGSIAFYTTEVNGIKNTIRYVGSLFSGAYIPLSYFPSTLRLVASVLPFAPVISGPVQALRVTSLAAAELTSLAVSVFWAATLLPVSLWLWRRSLRRYDAIGL